MLKLSFLFSDCAGLGFVLMMGRAGYGLVKHGQPLQGFAVAGLIFLYCVFYRFARRRA